MFAKMTLFAAALTIAAPVAAEPLSPNPPQVAVSYADLDLATSAGAEALNRRIRAAVKSVCQADPVRTELRRHMISARCIADTTIRANQRLSEVQQNYGLSRTPGRQVAAR